MKKPKISESQDRLSELPDSLVLVILSLLPTVDAVMTTLLSKRFKNLWTIVPCLNFKAFSKDVDEYGYFKCPNITFRNFVNRALFLWKGAKILKFKIVLLYEECPRSDVDVWLRFAMENEVEELYLDLRNDWDHEQWEMFIEYSPQQRLYSFSSIRKLTLVGCKLDINGNVQWDQLKYLKIDNVSLSTHVLNQILSGSPQLEVLYLCLSEIREDLSIHSCSLKGLTIDKYNEDRDDDSVLTIWAPNVEILEILGDTYGSYVIWNVSSLANVTADIYLDVDDDNVQSSGWKLLEDIMGKVYQTNRHVEKVTLSDWCIKMLGKMKKQEKRVFEPLSNAKFLKLYHCQVDDLMGLLEIFPKLTKLVLDNWRKKQRLVYQIRWGIHDPSITKSDTDNTLEAQTDFPKPRLLHLTTVEIAWGLDDDSIFPIVEFILRNASKLEKLVLRSSVSRLFDPELWFLRAEKLLRIPRLSPTAEVVLEK